MSRQSEARDEFPCHECPPHPEGLEKKGSLEVARISNNTGLVS